MHPPHHSQFTTPLASNISADQLSALNIEVRPESGYPAYIPDHTGKFWKEVGRIIVWDNKLIEVTPYRWSTERDLNELVEEAVTAKLSPPSTSDNWGKHTVRDREYWQCILTIAVDHDDPNVRTIRAAERADERQDREFRDRYNSAA